MHTSKLFTAPDARRGAALLVYSGLAARCPPRRTRLTRWRFAPDAEERIPRSRLANIHSLKNSGHRRATRTAPAGVLRQARRAPHSAACILRAARRMASVAVASAPAPRTSALLIRYVCANVSPVAKGVVPVTRVSAQLHSLCIAAVTSVWHLSPAASVGLTTTEYPLTNSDDVYDAEHENCSDLVVPVTRNAPVCFVVTLFGGWRAGACE